MSERTLAKEEQRLLDYIRRLEFGEAVVVVKAGLPVMIKQERKDIKLTD